MHITTNIQLIAITDVRSISISAVPTTAGTIALIMVDVAGTLLKGVASTLETLLVVEEVKCVLNSERCVSISCTLLTGGVTVNDCGDGVSAEYVDTVEQFMGTTMSSESQQLSSPLVQTVQALLFENVILMSNRVSVSFTSTVHQLTAVIVS